MKIADSTVNMMSGRNYTQTGMKNGVAGYESSFMGMINRYNTHRDNALAKDTYQSGKDNGGMGSYNMDDIGYFKGLGKITSGSLFGAGAGASAFQNNTLAAMFKRFASFGMMGGAAIGGYSSSMVTYSETEETGFHACGKACTEDGRTIDFNVNILMSRSYMEYMNVRIPTMADALFDPLIVNIGSDTADVRDQTFKFDLDADGCEDEISMLGKGSGFLALDKDGNGKIDDGNELFGTKSGDGLGEQRTEFTLGGADGYRDGVIRSTGVFLRESGGAGTIQHVDLSMKQNGLGTKVSGDDTVMDVSTSDNRNQSNATRRQEERRRQEAKARRRKADDKAAADAMYRRQMENRKYMNKLQERRFMERKEYHEELSEEQMEKLLEDQEAV